MQLAANFLSLTAVKGDGQETGRQAQLSGMFITEYEWQ